MVEMVVEFQSEGTAYLQDAGLLHIGPSPYSETKEQPLVGREVIFNGERRVIRYVEREHEVPLSIRVAVLNTDWNRAYIRGQVKRGDTVGFLFEDRPPEAGAEGADTALRAPL
jgi:hypothetical protein